MNRDKRKKQIARRSQIVIRVTFTIIIALMLIISIPHLFTKKYKLRNKGIDCYKASDYGKAIEYFDDALNCRQWFSSETDIDILMYKADCHIHLEQFHNAYESYNKILTDYKAKYYDKDSIKFLSNLSLCLESYSNGNYGSNAAVFAQAVDRGYTEMSLYAANCYEQNQDYQNMLKYYDIYTSNFGMSGLIAYKYSTYYMTAGDYNKALSYIESNLDKGGDYIDDLEYLQIVCYTKKMDFEKAFSLSESYVSKYPNDKNGKEMYDYLYTRVNIDTDVVNPIY